MDGEAEEAGGSLHTILLQRSALSAAVAAESGNRFVEVEPVACAFGQLMRMIGHSQLLCRPGEHADRHRLTTFEQHSSSVGVGK